VPAPAGGRNIGPHHPHRYDPAVVVPSASTFAVFAVAAVVLLLIPGPAVLYIVSQSVEHGRRAALVATAGVHAGTLVHITAAALGLSAILVSSASAFTAVRLAGAAYLVYLGVRALTGRDEARTPAGPREVRLGRVFRQGALVNVTNPKTALFFFAFLPQFVDTGRGGVGGQVAILGLTFMCLGLVTDGAYGLLAGAVAGWVRARPGYRRAQRWLTGTVFVGLGLATALSGDRRR
jgi:threonine/homoserine/homoserine lactone efflux protein